MKKVLIHHYSDILCVWAYVAQARIDELREVHGADVELHYHYVDVFGDVPGRLETRWSDKGGLSAYAAHVIEVASGFSHVKVHEDVWRKTAPRSSTSAHHFLHAVGLACGPVERARMAWALRVAFFAHARDVSAREVQVEVAEELKLDVSEICRQLDCGAAMARVSSDTHEAAAQNISVSPTLVFNEGRQILKGNVSYRVLEANVSELLTTHTVGHSWC